MFAFVPFSFVLFFALLILANTVCSFHQSCIENDNECPMCAQETHQIVELKRSLQENAADHDGFYKQLHGAKDGFGVVAEFFSRGMFMAQPPKAAPRK